MCYRVIEQHGGTLSAESVFGEWAQMILIFRWQHKEEREWMDLIMQPQQYCMSMTKK